MVKQFSIMTIKTAIYGAALLLGAACASCVTINANAKSIKCSGRSTEKTFSTSDFSGVTTRSSIDIMYTQGARSVKVSAPDNVMPYIEVKVKGGTLTVEFTDNVSITGDCRIVAYVSSPDIKEFCTQGSGDIVCKGELSLSHDLSLLTQGSGDIDLRTLSCTSLSALTQGSGDIEVGGASCRKSAGLTTQGSGDIEVKRIDTPALKAMSQGSGDISVGGRCDSADLLTQGSGDVEARGLKTVNLSVSEQGSGDIYVNR